MKKKMLEKKIRKKYFLQKKNIFTKKILLQKKFLQKNILPKVIPSFLAQVGEAENFSPKVPYVVTLALHDFGLSLG